jgi:ribosomal protein L16/L10AE
MTLGHRATAARRQRRGPPVSRRYVPSDATTQHRIEDRMQRGSRQDPTYPRR